MRCFDSVEAMTVEADIFKDAETECPSKWIRGYFDAKGTDEKESFLKKLEEELKKNGKSVDDYKMSYLDVSAFILILVHFLAIIHAMLVL